MGARAGLIVVCLRGEINDPFGLCADRKAYPYLGLSRSLHQFRTALSGLKGVMSPNGMPRSAMRRDDSRADPEMGRVESGRIELGAADAADAVDFGRVSRREAGDHQRE
jgi:hypothetical protein